MHAEVMLWGQCDNGDLGAVAWECRQCGHTLMMWENVYDYEPETDALQAKK